MVVSSCDSHEATAPTDGVRASVTAGVAAKLSFSANPRNTPVNGTMAPAVQVSVLDGLGNLVPDYTGNVTLTLAAGTGTPGASLLGTTTVAAVAGIATFATLGVDTPGTGYKLSATAAGLTGATSAGFFVSGPAAVLAFTVEPPASGPVGVALTPAVRVTALDALGNRALGFTGLVTLAITPGTGASGATLSGTTGVTASSGVASFYTLRINAPGTGYTLTATAGGLPAAISTPFDLVLGPAAKLAFTVSPSTTTAGAVFAPAVQVTALDASGNLVPGFTGSVTVGISASGGGTPGAALAGTTTVQAVGGVATFATLSIATPGTGYQLAAQASGLTPAASASFNITYPATTLVFSVQPATTTAGVAFAPAVQVTALDALGNRTLGFTGSVSVAITSGTGAAGAVLAGTTTVAATGGVATFSGGGGLHINKAGTGFTLTATAAGLSAATSTAFDVTVGAAAKLSFSVNPRSAAAGATLVPVQVSALDAVGNLVGGFGGTITLAMAPGTGTPGAALAGATSVAAAGGVATFSTLSVATPGTNYRLTAAAPGLTGATSGTFTISGPATALAFSVEPATIAAGVVFTPGVRLTALDALGNRALGFAGTVTMAIAPGTGATGALLDGTPAVVASAGVATFYTLRIDQIGSAYALTATAPGLTPATSTPFDITLGPPTKLSFAVNPMSTAAGSPITPPVQVAVLDAGGNPVPSYTGTVTVAISPVTGIPGATLGGTTTVAAVGGVATFTTLSIGTPGTGYRLAASASGLTPATSGIFTIN